MNGLQLQMIRGEETTRNLCCRLCCTCRPTTVSSRL